MSRVGQIVLNRGHIWFSPVPLKFIINRFGIVNDP